MKIKLVNYYGLIFFWNRKYGMWVLRDPRTLRPQGSQEPQDLRISDQMPVKPDGQVKPSLARFNQVQPGPAKSSHQQSPVADSHQSPTITSPQQSPVTHSHQSQTVTIHEPSQSN